MNRHGHRFVEVKDFISYCRDLNINTHERELEHYEKIGAMLPVARVVYPKKYIVQQTQNTLEGLWNWDGFEEWPDLERLTERMLVFPTAYINLTDKELVHSFDREMGNNPFLIPNPPIHTGGRREDSGRV